MAMLPNEPSDLWILPPIPDDGEPADAVDEVPSAVASEVSIPPWLAVDPPAAPPVEPSGPVYDRTYADEVAALSTPLDPAAAREREEDERAAALKAASEAAAYRRALRKAGTIVGPEEGGDAWPEMPDGPAFAGLAGDIVRAVAGGTEADPVAILGSLLATFGALCGRHCTIYQGATHGPNLFVVLVGDSSRGRKGTAGSVVRDVFSAAVAEWDKILVPGLGSGEGLIHRLRSTENKPAEPRALVYETEFGRLLTIMAREGSTLSPTLRDGWDGSPIGRFLARESELVRDHHVGVLGHVTPEELREKLTGVDAANGFGNRFLWLAVRRSRLVPFPTSPGRAVAPPLLARLHRAVAAAQERRELAWTPAAARQWEAMYTDLTDRRRLGLAAMITARAEAQIVRLALVYALLECATAVDVDHLEAALDLWDYAERSATFLFGESTGNRHADVVLRLLREEPAHEVPREAVKAATGLRLGAELDALEAVLVNAGLAEVVYVKGRDTGAGRPRRVLRLRNRRNSQNGLGARAQERVLSNA